MKTISIDKALSENEELREEYAEFRWKESIGSALKAIDEMLGDFGLEIELVEGNDYIFRIIKKQ